MQWNALEQWKWTYHCYTQQHKWISQTQCWEKEARQRRVGASRLYLCWFQKTGKWGCAVRGQERDCPWGAGSRRGQKGAAGGGSSSVLWPGSGYWTVFSLRNTTEASLISVHFPTCTLRCSWRFVFSKGGSWASENPGLTPGIYPLANNFELRPSPPCL